MTGPIHTEHLRKVFPAARRFLEPTIALDDVTLDVPAGAFYALLGRNGEGKSTLMRCLLGLVRPTSGEALLLGERFATLSPEERARVAYVPQRDQLAGNMTVRQYALYFQHLFPTWDAVYAEALLDRFGLPRDRAIKTLSGGIQRKVAIALALASGAQVLLLDEPAAGLDPVARRELIAELVDVIATVEQVTVLFSTHLLADLEHLADHVGILHEGRMLVSEPVETLRAGYGRLQIICTTDHEAQHLELPAALRLERLGRVLHALVEAPDRVIAELARAAPEAQVECFPLSLEDLFVELMQAIEPPRLPRWKEVA